ncbi:MAG TPA: glycerol kinase GlpK [Candidatus Coproplasma stercoripullorum]|uniref:Glycerol kinase n=1 Tax=Candidatus Coproplasma stercoripullorum TaxID=2840751 RepID=A0A9D1DBC7_9FIRM|nr:glycerol kinase GlpK [Candidatus Coproplasma stercoripullorum]
MKYIIALDQGTTSTRAVLFDKSGAIVSSYGREIEQFYPAPGLVEHDAEELFFSSLRAVQRAMELAGASASDIAALGITNQRETAIVWEKKTGRPVCNAIVWQCRRTAGRCRQLEELGLTGTIRKKTGLIPDPYFSATKLEWILKNVPGARQRAERGELLFGTVDTWLVWRLTGGTVFATDYTNASRTMLFNIHTLEWDDELLELFGVPRCMLPEVLPCGGDFGVTEHGFFGGGIPIRGVAGDQQAALFGHLCLNEGEAKNTYGTGCFLLMNAGKRACTESGLLTTLAACVDGRPNYALEGSVFIGGAAVQWLRDGLGLISSAAETEELAERVKDSAGMYFVPAFNGLGAPYWDGSACGILSGITRGAKKEHIVRAVLEGMAYRVNDVLRAMEAASGVTLSRLAVDGGASANNFLMGFQADISGCEVVRPANTEVTSLGAAYIAGLSSCFWKNLDEVRGNVKVDRVFSAKMSAERRGSLLEGWRRAVQKSQV